MPDLYLFPNWDTNPYLAMLTMEARAQGWTVRGSIRHTSLLKDLRGLGAGDVFHLHWTAPLAEAADAEEFSRRIERLDAELAAARDCGVHVMWTVHNVTTHDAAHPTQEIALAEVLAERADRILVLNSRTAQVAAPLYSLPETKIRHLPHASYQGLYPRSPGRRAAREMLGIAPGRRVLGFAGAIRPYKGVDDLLAAARLLASRDPRIEVALAGGASRADIFALERELPRELHVHRQYGRLTDEEITTWISASDVLVLPYSAILNSGTMMLAATLGVPVVLPGLDHLRAEHGGEAWIEFFDADAQDRPAAVAEAVRRVLDSPSREREQAALACAARYRPRHMALDYLRLLPTIGPDGPACEDRVASCPCSDS